ncbi:hypothetical protein [Methylotenera sp.]|uniref:hypothetical protein n=1 Tax=Methylotenera sp. TaxID=2051956 RepID=UPI0024895E3C|nr:hypothetical protein [Methylotenera sp.]MDI1298759.1 hypothetical protein [Methylotenera sp.]
MSLQDQHLQQALKHAPDSELMPSDATQKAVLAYADSALKQTHETWLTRLYNVWHEWFGSSWHITGIGSAVATVLVVVVFWHQLPDDTMLKVATPSEPAERRSVDVSADSVDQLATTETNTEKTVQKKLNKVTAPRKEKSSLPAAQQAVAPLAKEAQMSAVIAAPASAPIMQDNAAAQTAVAGTISLPEVAQPAPKVELNKKAASSTKLDAALSKSIALRDELADLLAEIGVEGGVVAANKDIQALRLRLLVLNELRDQSKGACSSPTSRPAVIDTTTGYHIETISLCNVSASLLSEVEACNQTMRNWHAKHGNN